MHNHAHSGGAIQTIETKLNICGTVICIIANNSTIGNGSGVYTYHSEAVYKKGGKLKFLGNRAAESGGTFHAAGSSIIVKIHNPRLLLHTVVEFEDNRAEKSGALFLEIDAKLYMLKSEATCSTKREEIIKFTAKVAEYRGAVSISDEGILCAISTKYSECPIQILVLHSIQILESESSTHKQCEHIYYHKNTDTVSGNSLYGGLVDRCTVSLLAEVTANITEENTDISNTTTTVGGLEYLYSISNIRSSDIGSLVSTSSSLLL